MKNKTINIILGIALCISVCGNIFLIKNWLDARGQMTVFSNQIVVADDQINNLHDQLSDFENLENEILALQSQLADSEEQAGLLENSLSESEAQVESLEAVLAENQATIAELEKQQEIVEKPAVTQPVQQQQPSVPVNNIPGPVFGGASFDGNPTGTGTGMEHSGDFGIFE